MNISGKAKFKASSHAIWEALHSKKVLMYAIPGCQSFTLNDEGKYNINLKLGIAVIKGEYIGKACVEDVEEPTQLRLMALGCGKQGVVDMQINFMIEPLRDGCQVMWKCDAKFGGMIAKVGNRVMGVIAKFLAENFLKVYKSSFMRECENKVIGTIQKMDRACHLLHFVIDFR